ncbi:MAG: hypothetical protein RR603_01015 [Kurthia sp.]
MNKFIVNLFFALIFMFLLYKFGPVIWLFGFIAVWLMTLVMLDQKAKKKKEKNE